MQESVDSEENTEINNDSSCDNSVRARSLEIPERASKILKNDSYSDCEEHINLDESPSEPTSLSMKIYNQLYYISFIT